MDKHAIAAAYEAAPEEITVEARWAWHELARYSTGIANLVRLMIVVKECPFDSPYPNTIEMGRDICFKQRLSVSTTNCEHPLWTPDQNINFRIAHDVAGHYVSGGAFSWAGELVTYEAQGRLMPRAARRALFTEVVGQTAYRSVHGEFPTQKAVLLPMNLMEEE